MLRGNLSIRGETFSRPPKSQSLGASAIEAPGPPLRARYRAKRAAQVSCIFAGGDAYPLRWTQTPRRILSNLVNEEGSNRRRCRFRSRTHDPNSPRHTKLARGLRIDRRHPRRHSRAAGGLGARSNRRRRRGRTKLPSGRRKCRQRTTRVRVQRRRRGQQCKYARERRCGP